MRTLEPSSPSSVLALHVLASGSKGNATLVENRQTQSVLLIDCGLTRRDFLERLSHIRPTPRTIDAILISHDHSDHVKGLGVVLRALKPLTPIPIFGSQRLLKTCKPVQEVIDQGLGEFFSIEAGVELERKGFLIKVFATSHDAPESFGFRIMAPTTPPTSPQQEFGALSDTLGYITDTGFVSAEALGALRSVRILAIECNHDPEMLWSGSYPQALKERVGSKRGHLSNDQAAEALSHLIHPGLEHVIAMHVSQNNNTYHRAVSVLEEVLASIRSPATIQSAYQDRAISVY